MRSVPNIGRMAREWMDHDNESGYDVMPLDDYENMLEEFCSVIASDDDPEVIQGYVDNNYPYIIQDEFFCDMLEELLSL